MKRSQWWQNAWAAADMLDKHVPLAHGILRARQEEWTAKGCAARRGGHGEVNLRQSAAFEQF